MKRLMIVALAGLCVAALLPQPLSAGIGIKGGYSLSNFSISGIDAPPFTTLDSPVGGIFFSFKLGPLAIQPEILYVRMGAEFEVDEDNGLQYCFDYIQVPVLLKLSILPLGPVCPVIYAGGYGAYLFKAKGVMTVDGVPDEADLIDEYQKYDYGLIGGVGIEFKLPGIRLSVEGRYNYGLQNILTAPGAGESWKNTSTMVLVGIGF